MYTLFEYRICLQTARTQSQVFTLQRPHAVLGAVLSTSELDNCTRKKLKLWGYSVHSKDQRSLSGSIVLIANGVDHRLLWRLITMLRSYKLAQLNEKTSSSSQSDLLRCFCDDASCDRPSNPRACRNIFGLTAVAHFFRRSLRQFSGRHFSELFSVSFDVVGRFLILSWEDLWDAETDECKKYVSHTYVRPQFWDYRNARILWWWRFWLPT